ncbi:MAG TPA: hypothetical protein VFN22_09950 [Gemmatimonadales bacterium]|nr:hypothetical protein [Gemmatimonadales bacterium]
MRVPAPVGRTLILPMICLTVLVLPVAAQDPQIAPNAPADCALALSATQQDQIDVALAPLFAEARRTWPAVRDRYRQGLPGERSLFVTTRIFDPDGRNETVFIAVDSVASNRITGRIWNRLMSVRSFRPRQQISFADSLLLDWTITQPDGSEEGNAVGKFLDRCQQQGRPGEGRP